MKVVNTVIGNNFKLPNPGLDSFLDRTERGSSDDYRTPFWNKAPREEVLSKWDEVIERSDVNSLMEGLYEIEREQRAKVGPMSVMKPFEQRMEDVTNYFTLPKVGSPLPVEAIKAMKRRLRRGSLVLASAKNTVLEMKLNTNSGSPYFTKRRKVVDATLLKLQWEIDKAIAVLGWRGQPGGPEVTDVKQRVVWMMPLALNIVELQFYKVLIKAWQTDGTFPGLISLRAVEESVTKLFDTKGMNDLVVATDFSKFDQHFNQTLQDVAKDLILYQFRRSEHSHIERYFPMKYNIGIVCTHGVTITGPHGMGSGSGGTNPDENLAHSCLQHTAAFEHGEELNPYSTVVGDDGILSYKGITVEDVVSSYTARGLEMNKDKQYADKHSTIFLQRYYHDKYRDSTGIMLGVYSTYRALGRLLGQERYYDEDKWNNKMVTLRAWSIIENTKNHPLFEKFVDFVYAGDKFGLGTKIPDFFADLDKTVDEARELIPDLLGYSQGQEYEGSNIGIKEWRVYKYLFTKYVGGSHVKFITSR